MKNLFSIPLMLLSTLMLTAACSEEDQIPDGQEQTTPGENENEENESEEGGNGISLLQGTENVNVRFERQ